MPHEICVYYEGLEPPVHDVHVPVTSSSMACFALFVCFKNRIVRCCELQKKKIKSAVIHVDYIRIDSPFMMCWRAETV